MELLDWGLFFTLNLSSWNPFEVKKLLLSGECALHLRKGTKTAAVLSCWPWLSIQAQLTFCLLLAKRAAQGVFLPGWAGTSFRRPGPAASVSLPPCPMGRDARFDTTCTAAWKSGHTHMWWSHTLSLPTEPSVLASHPHPSLYTHRETWGCCGHKR